MVKVNKLIKLRNEVFPIGFHQKSSKSFTNSVARRIQRFELLLTICGASLRFTKTYFLLCINRMDTNHSKRLNFYESLFYTPFASLCIQPSFRTAIIIFIKVHIVVIPITDAGASEFFMSFFIFITIATNARVINFRHIHRGFPKSTAKVVGFLLDFLFTNSHLLFILRISGALLTMDALIIVISCSIERHFHNIIIFIGYNDRLRCSLFYFANTTLVGIIFIIPKRLILRIIIVKKNSRDFHTIHNFHISHKSKPLSHFLYILYHIFSKISNL